MACRMTRGLSGARTQRIGLAAFLRTIGGRQARAQRLHYISEAGNSERDTGSGSERWSVASAGVVNNSNP